MSPPASAASAWGDPRGVRPLARERTAASGESEPGTGAGAGASRSCEPGDEGEPSRANGDLSCGCRSLADEGGPLLRSPRSPRSPRSLRRELREARWAPGCENRPETSGISRLARCEGVPATDDAAPMEHINELSELPHSSSSKSPPCPASRSRLWRAANSGDESISSAVGRPTAAKTSN